MAKDSKDRPIIGSNKMIMLLIVMIKFMIVTRFRHSLTQYLDFKGSNTSTELGERRSIFDI